MHTRILPHIFLLLIAATARADKVVLVAGGGTGGDGSKATEAKLVQPFAIDFAPDGSLLFVEMVGGERLRKIAPDGTISTLAGTGKKGNSGDGGPGPQAEFNGMHNLVVNPDGTVLLADTFNHRIRKYDPRTGLVTAVAGTGKRGYMGDGGEASDAHFDQVICIAAAGDQVWVADIGNRRVRLVNTIEDSIRPFAGNGQRGVPKDGGAARNQPLVDPRAVAVHEDKSGRSVYILERAGHALRVVERDGTIRTVAGTGKPGRGGDGGPALKAAMNGPKYVSIDRDGSVLIADTENHQIRRYVPGKETMELVAGTGKKGSAGVGGDPLKLEMGRPHGVIAHPKTGEIHIADSDNGRILKIVK